VNIQRRKYKTQFRTPHSLSQPRTTHGTGGGQVLRCLCAANSPRDSISAQPAVLSPQQCRQQRLQLNEPRTGIWRPAYVTATTPTVTSPPRLTSQSAAVLLRIWETGFKSRPRSRLSSLRFINVPKDPIPSHLKKPIHIRPFP
jgi:hypothetical protein